MLLLSLVVFFCDRAHDRHGCRLLRGFQCFFGHFQGFRCRLLGFARIRIHDRVVTLNRIDPLFKEWAVLF